jgi:hypothetical protein
LELRHPRFAKIAPFHELIRDQLAVNTMSTLHQPAPRRAWSQGQHRQLPPLHLATIPDREALRGQVTVLKDDLPRGEEAPARLRLTGPVGSGHRQAPSGVGVCDGAGLLAAPVRRPVVAMPVSAWIEARVAALCFSGGMG